MYNYPVKRAPYNKPKISTSNRGMKFEEIINENSFRNIPSSKDNKVNYMKYKEIIYNFEYIEELLGQGLLFGKKTSRRY